MRALAAMKSLRRHGSRYREEQAAIERWLAAVEAACPESWQCAYEIALCGRLIKGYGATNKRGKANLAHILDHLATAKVGADERAAAIRDARDAALTDEGGKALDAALTGTARRRARSPFRASHSFRASALRRSAPAQHLTYRRFARGPG